LAILNFAVVLYYGVVVIRV